MGKTTTFISDGFEIQGRFSEGDKDKGVIITHPHPLYGGNMQNNVGRVAQGNLTPTLPQIRT